MRNNSYKILILLLLSTPIAGAQGTFVFDQQSSDETNIQEGGADIQQSQPMGQSFVPTLSTVGFIRLYIYNGLEGDRSAATIQVSLRADSLAGRVLGTSVPVTIPGGASFVGPVNFIFPTAVNVTPGTTYFFQPIIQDNHNLGLSQSLFYNYQAGTAFFLGVPDQVGRDLWFREGIIVPEPCSTALILVGLLLYIRKRQTWQYDALLTTRPQKSL